MSDEQKRESDKIRAALERESVTKKGKGSQVGYGADEPKTQIEPSRGEEPREEIIGAQEPIKVRDVETRSDVVPSGNTGETGETGGVVYETPKVIPSGFIELPNRQLVSIDDFNKTYMPAEDDFKYISDFVVPYSLSYGGGEAVFQIQGDNDARFKLEIKNSDGNWYNWDTTAFTSTPSYLIRKIRGEFYEDKFVFAEGTKTETFTYTLHALIDDCGKTKHAKRVEVFKDDGTIDLNNSVGSDSQILQKESYQGPVVNLTVSSKAPTLADGGEVFNGATHSSQAIGSSVDSRRASKNGKFKITVTAASGKAIKIDRQPTPNDVCLYTTAAIGAATPGDYSYVIPGEDIWNGTARSTKNVGSSGGVSEGRNITMVDDRSTFWAVGDRVTGNTALDAKTGSEAVYITAVDVGNAKTFTVSENVTVANGESLTFTPPRYYRWPVTNYVGLYGGSVPKNNTNITSGSFISSYQAFRSKFIQTSTGCETYNVTAVNKDISVGAIERTATPTYTTYGRVNSAAGILTFNKPQYKSFESTTHDFYTYGERLIKEHLKAGTFKITNLKAEIETENIVTTTINDVSADGSASLNDFDVTSINGIMDDVSIVSGANINVRQGEPTVTTISSNNVTLTPGSHTVQNGETLTFSGAASIITITGNIEVDDIGDASTTIYFDVEKFLTCA